MAIGSGICKFAFMGAVTRYIADEVAPVGKDVVNYMVDGTKDSVRDLAASVSEGISEGVQTHVMPERRKRFFALSASMSTTLKLYSARTAAHRWQRQSAARIATSRTTRTPDSVTAAASRWLR